jgi:trans-aconitate 2-methyltransferase
VFAAPTRRFLTDDVGRTEPALALDLGCGPGHTTRLVHECTGASRTIGIDMSAAFLAAARAGAPTGIEFLEHDITALPFPTGAPDLIYCRLVLAHLPDPAAVVADWMVQLTPGGVLAVDEVESIEAVEPTLERYEELVVELVASRCAHMYVGPILDAMPTPDSWRRRSSRLVQHFVPVADAARMYGLNLATWRDDPHMRDHHGPGELDEIAAGLAQLAASTEPGATVEWGLRQVVFERAV